MKMRIYLVLCLMVLVAGSAHAAYLFDWSGPSVHMTDITDPVGDTSSQTATGADITALMWARDDNNTYFRMDLLDGFPGTSLYGIYISDSTVGGTGGNFYMPEELDSQGITYFITTPRNADYLWSTQSYAWNGAAFDPAGPASNFQVSPYPTYNIPGTVTLEWQIANSQLPNDFTFWGGTMGWTSGGDRHTVDLTDAASTPEPATLALLGIGLGGVFLKRRRNKA